jgi:hypothetical protein
MSGSPIGDEAGKLWEALQQWLAGSDSADQGATPLANGSPECCVCPVCQVISLARHTRPEVVEHVANIAAEAYASFRTFLETAGTDESAAAGQQDETQRRAAPEGRRGGVERIDVEDG